MLPFPPGAQDRPRVGPKATATHLGDMSFSFRSCRALILRDLRHHGCRWMQNVGIGDEAVAYTVPRWRPLVLRDPGQRRLGQGCRRLLISISKRGLRPHSHAGWRPVPVRSEVGFGNLRPSPTCTAGGGGGGAGTVSCGSAAGLSARGDVARRTGFARWLCVRLTPGNGGDVGHWDRPERFPRDPRSRSRFIEARASPVPARPRTRTDAAILRGDK